MEAGQLDKEKRDLPGRLRIVARRLDHTERAFCQAARTKMESKMHKRHERVLRQREAEGNRLAEEKGRGENRKRRKRGLGLVSAVVRCEIIA